MAARSTYTRPRPEARTLEGTASVSPRRGAGGRHHPANGDGQKREYRGSHHQAQRRHCEEPWHLVEPVRVNVTAREPGDQVADGRGEKPDAHHLADILPR